MSPNVSFNSFNSFLITSFIFFGLFKIIGHRGAPKYCHENTLSCFEQAYKCKATAIEFDLRQTKDKEIIVIHDPSIDRVTTGSGEVRNMSLKEIRKYNIDGERIPTLREVFEKFSHKMAFDIEIKVENIEKTFKQVATTYKYFWFLAILESIYMNGSRIIPVRELLARMVANAWHPAIQSGLDFGKQDKLPEICQSLSDCTTITPDMNRLEIYDMVVACMEDDASFAHKVMRLGNLVPYRFLRPFFNEELREIRDSLVNLKIVNLASEHFYDKENFPVYRFIDLQRDIEVHSEWFSYLRKYIKEFAELTTIYLRQRKNILIKETFYLEKKFIKEGSYKKYRAT